MAEYVKYFLGSIRPTPAIAVMNVRTIGTNRAMTMARAPYFSKKPWVFSTYSFLNSLESGLLNSVGPALTPIQ